MCLMGEKMNEKLINCKIPEPIYDLLVSCAKDNCVSTIEQLNRAVIDLNEHMFKTSLDSSNAWNYASHGEIGEPEIKTTEIPFSKVSVKPGDVIVISCAGNMSKEELKLSNERLKTLFPNNKSMVPQDGLTLGVVEQDVPMDCDNGQNFINHG